MSRRWGWMLALLATGAWAVPAWFPKFQTLHPAPHPELTRYLATEQLAIADSIHSMGTAEVDGKRLVVHAWIPAGATGTVFLVNGYYNQCGIWSQHIGRLLARQLAVVTFDLPGQGLSDGQRMDIDSFAQYAKGLRAVEDSMRLRAPLPWSLVGHSLGGAIALDRARGPNFPYQKVLLLAPMLRYQGWGWTGAVLAVASPFKATFARQRKVTSSFDTAFQQRILTDPLEGWFSATHWLLQVRAWNAHFAGAKLAPAKWLLLQGGLDETVDWKWAMPRLQAQIPGLKTRWFPLARHHLHNEGGLTGATIRRDFDDFLALPSSQVGN